MHKLSLPLLLLLVQAAAEPGSGTRQRVPARSWEGGAVPGAKRRGAQCQCGEFGGGWPQRAQRAQRPHILPIGGVVPGQGAALIQAYARLARPSGHLNSSSGRPQIIRW